MNNQQSTDEELSSNHSHAEALGILLLENGELFVGYSVGCPLPAVEQLPEDWRGEGEVVFNTGMVGYPEIFTDISYRGQILVMTYPHIGNYAIDPLWSESHAVDAAQRPPVQIQGLIVRSLYQGAIPPQRHSIADYLRSAHTPALTDVDTRSLTLMLRNKGSLRGILVAAPPSFGRWDSLEKLPSAWLARGQQALSRVPSLSGRNLVSGLINPQQSNQPAPSATTTPSKAVVLLNCGYKENIARMLRRRGCQLTIVESTSSPAAILHLRPYLLVISNGPGDPEVLQRQIWLLRQLLDQVPLFGICLGHQLLSLALGATTYKMKFGHHGINHPVRSCDGDQLFVTSQNHEFAVREESLPAESEVWFRNANDATIEGIRSRRHRLAAVQFHPEAAPGPHDCQWLFDYALEEIAQ